MSKHHLNETNQGEGIRLVGNPIELIDLLIAGDSEKEWAANQLINEGSKHKQVLNTLLLKRLYKLMRAVEESSGSNFVLQNGYGLKKAKDAGRLPIPFPINIGWGMDKVKVTEAIAAASERDQLAYAMFLQVIEWSIRTVQIAAPAQP